MIFSFRHTMGNALLSGSTTQMKIGVAQDKEDFLRTSSMTNGGDDVDIKLDVAGEYTSGGTGRHVYCQGSLEPPGHQTGRCIGTTQPAHNGYEPRQEINNQPAAAMEGRRADCDVHAITEAIQHSIRLHAPSSLAALVRLVSQRLESHYGISRSIRELFDRTVLLLYGMRPAQQPVARTPRPAPPKGKQRERERERVPQPR